MTLVDINPEIMAEHQTISQAEEITSTLFLEGISKGTTSQLNKIYGCLIEPDNLWEFTLDLAFHEDYKVAFRGSWALEWAYYNDRNAFRPHFPHFVDNFLKAENPSVHRIYTKMLWDMQHRGLLLLDDKQVEEVAAKSFDLLINPGTKTAVKTWAMEILFDLSERLNWVDEQLRDTIQQIMESEHGMGVINHGRRVLKRIDKRHGSRQE